MNSRLSAMASRTFTKQRAKDTARSLGPVLLALAISPSPLTRKVPWT